MTHSNLTSVVIHSPNGYFPRSASINKITIHHMAGVMTAEQCGYVFSSSARQASSNYGIGNDGKIACYVEEENAAWTSSSYWNDSQSVTMEVSNSYAGDPWPISDAAWKSMIALCADICTRYGIEPYYDGTTGGTFTEHRMFAATGCPGQYIHERMYQIVKEVKAAMNGTGGEWIKDDRGWWYKRFDGSYPASEWEKINDKWYYFDSKGYMVEGWLTYNGEKYYLKPKDGDMQIGWLTLNGKKYFFDEDGKMVTGFYKGKKSGAWYCFEKTGVLVTDVKRLAINSSGKITIK